MSTKVKLARISTVPYFVVSQLAGQLDAIVGSDISVTVISSDGPELSMLKSGALSHRIITVEIARSISFLKDIRALRRLFLIFRQERFDIVHSTNPKAGLISAIAGLFAGVPVRLHTFTGQPWVHMHGPFRSMARWGDCLIGKLNTRCYADSESQRRFLVEQRVVLPKQISVIGAGSIAGVNLERFNMARFTDQARAQTRTSLGIPPDAPVLLFVGRITVDKGVRELMVAFQQIKKMGSRAHLVFVGPFDTERSEGNEITRSAIVDIPDTHIMGYTEQPEVYMAIADILCLPSYREGFGTVVIEAAAMGVPTVGTDIYGLSDAVVNGETGILVPPRDPAALAWALSSLFDDPVRCGEMGDAAKRRAEMFFDAKQINEKVIAEYHRLVSCVLHDEDGKVT
ncbi:MAG: glycosyltransferase family 4 protein [Proteobacteria bacterium]|nr:glycosyltransferase family 4 protein [Pseudomonadota bacterium]MCG2822087.1 glycosyltransferase family 4 protein [Desulfobulbaceae bacterium]